MAPRPRALVASTDRTLPTKFVGKLEPNALCRGWNAKKRHYCSKPAGSGTTHQGVGRCKFHGGLQDGDRRVRSGAGSRVKTTSLEQLIAQERQRPDPLDLSGELATLRALVRDLRRRNPDAPDVTAEITLADTIARTVERIERIRSQNAISRAELNRIMHELWRAIDVRVQDDDVKAEIREDWMRISL